MPCRKTVLKALLNESCQKVTLNWMMTACQKTATIGKMNEDILEGNCDDSGVYHRVTSRALG